jgi:tetratricopeptide (TPR) repeat protein
MRMGDMERAVQYFERAIELRPGYWENYNRLGICYYTFGRYQDAAEQFRRVIMIQPDNYMGYGTLGGIHTLLGQYEDAIVMHERAINIYPNASSYANLGTCYFYLGRCDDAIAAYRAAIELDQRDDIVYRNLGDAYLCLQKEQDAQHQFKVASELLKERLTINPESAELLGRLAICYAKLHDDSGALTSIERASALEPRNTTLMYQQAIVYALIGRADEAIESLRNALSSGYSRSEAERDPDLQSLRSKAEYQSLFANNRDSRSSH